MLPIITFGIDEKLLISENTIIIKYRSNTPSSIGWSMLYLKIEDLTVSVHLNDDSLTDIVWCYGQSSVINIIFDQALTIQEVAEELSQKFEYNMDRIHAAIANTKNIELALVPRSKRAL
jgi:hypothetical protein